MTIKTHPPVDQPRLPLTAGQRIWHKPALDSLTVDDTAAASGTTDDFNYGTS